jgi:hypothetical protein
VSVARLFDAHQKARVELQEWSAKLTELQFREEQRQFCSGLQSYSADLEKNVKSYSPGRAILNVSLNMNMKMKMTTKTLASCLFVVASYAQVPKVSVGARIEVKEWTMVPCSVKTGDLCYYSYVAGAKLKVTRVGDGFVEFDVISGATAHYADNVFGMKSASFTTDQFNRRCKIITNKTNKESRK